MGILKQYVQNRYGVYLYFTHRSLPTSYIYAVFDMSFFIFRYRPEGSIVEGYAAEEVIEFCIDYMEANQPIGVPRSRHEGRLDGVGTIERKTITWTKPDMILRTSQCCDTRLRL